MSDETSVVDTMSEQELEQALKSKRAQRNAEIKERVRAIRAGEVVGDPLELFVEARYHGADDGRYLAKYQAIAEQVAAHVGELVLMIKREEKCGARGGPRYVPRPSAYSIQESRYLGVVGSGELAIDLARDSCAIALAGNAVQSSGYRVRNATCIQQLESTEFASRGMSDWGHELNEPLNKLNGRYGDVPIRLEFIIGDGAVRAWFEAKTAFRKPLYEHQFELRDMAELLGHPIELPILDAYCAQRVLEVLKELRTNVRFGQHLGGSGCFNVEQLLREARMLRIEDETPLVTIATVREMLE